MSIDDTETGAKTAPRKRRTGFGSIRKLPSGRYQARYRGPDGQYHNGPTTFRLKREAEAWLAMQDAAITESRWKPPSRDEKMTFATYFDGWLAQRELKPRTRVEYERMGKVLKETFGPLRLIAITPATVRDWYATMAATPSTRGHTYGLLRTVLNGALEDELIDANPCRIRGGSSTKRTKVIKPATLDELDTIASEMPERYRAMLLLAAWCQLRFGELTELRRKDIDLKTDTILVRRAVTWIDGNPVVGDPKTDAGIRDVAIPPHIIDDLKQHLKKYAQPGPEGLMFPAVESDGQMRHGGLYKVFRRARKVAGREDLRWHDLRHTGATMLAQNGASIAELQRRLGHTTAQAAMCYQHATDERDRLMAERLSESVKARPTPAQD